jgi:hypothetical protein
MIIIVIKKYASAVFLVTSFSIANHRNSEVAHAARMTAVSAFQGQSFKNTYRVPIV